MTEAVPQAVETRCPDCGEETLHAVLHGRVGRKGGLTLDATVKCDACGRVHHVVMREAPDVDLPVVLSFGATSRTSRVSLPGDELLRVGDEVLVDGLVALVTGLEGKDQTRKEALRADLVRTVWAKEFDSVRVRVAINLRKKTAAKDIQTHPDREFGVGQELVFGRLRVTVHGIKIKGRMLRRGFAPARDIVRVFAKPTRGETLDTPAPPSEEALAAGVARERTAVDAEGDPDDLAAWDELDDPEEDE